MGDGRLDGKPFIDEALLRAMGRPVQTEAARAGLEIGYALGLARRDRFGAPGRCHGGSTVGFRAMLCTYPEQGKAYFYALLVSGVVRMARRRMPVSHPTLVPVLTVLALFLPLPFFLRQSFLQLGDLTVASGLLALATAALPLAMVTCLALHLRRRAGAALAALDIAAMLAVLQWAMVLAAWGLLPLRLWS
jgi:hypothetical protein